MATQPTLLNHWGWQQQAPVSFIQAQHGYPRRIWWPAWGARFGNLGLIAGVLAGVSAATGQSYPLLLGWMALWLCLLQLCCCLPIIVLGEIQFWLLYSYSPLVVGIALFCGLSLFSPVGIWLGLALGLPWLVGKMLTDASAVWVWRETEKTQREWQRRGYALGNPSATPGLWQRVRRFRLGLAVLLAAGAGYLGVSSFAGHGTREYGIVLAVLAGPLGCLQLETTLLMLLTKAAPVQYLAAETCWRATYLGRNALFMPRRSWQAWLSPTISLSAQSAILLVLLNEGCLGPDVRRGFQSLPPPHLHRLFLHLSLQPGGAAALRYLCIGLPADLQTLGRHYASLAEEAAKPLALQQWLHLLAAPWPETVPPPIGLIHDPRTSWQSTYQAWLDFTPQASPLATALQQLSQLIDELYGKSPANGFAAETAPDPALSLTWPVILYRQLLEQRRRLSQV